jgi:glycosyl hydrolase family 20
MSAKQSTNWLLALALLLVTLPLNIIGASSPDPLILIPQPQQVEVKEGIYKLNTQSRIFLSHQGERPELMAALKLAEACANRVGVTVPVDRPGLLPLPEKDTILLAIKESPDTDPIVSQGYTLEIYPDNIKLVGNSPTGLFYGIQTLNQMVKSYGGKLPCVYIEDAPDLQYRGFFFDLSRGRVAKLETLKWLVDYLAAEKINMLQFNVEHVFAFRFDPEITHGDGLSPEEILELDAYCLDRRVELVPSFQAFGHMAAVLSMERYRHLADVELEGEWEELEWNQRMKGATFDVTNPETLELLEKMFDSYLPLFTSKLVNVGADETYDLGKGKTKDLADEIGKDSLYLQHIKWLGELCEKYDKRMMFWGDIIKKDPERVPELPKNIIPMDWGYWRNTNFEGSKVFADAELDFFVCPGTSSFRRFLNFYGNADPNIRGHAKSGKKHGAMGLLNTDWGDHGHINMLAGSLHLISLGAAMSWNVDAPDEATFDRIWNQFIFGKDDSAVIKALKSQDEADKGYLATWIYFYQPFTSEKLLEKTTDEKALRMKKGAQETVELLEEYRKAPACEPWIIEELLFASKMNLLYVEKYEIAKSLQSTEELTDDEKTALAKRLNSFADQIDIMKDQYIELWLAKSKPSDLDMITNKLDALAAESREIAEGL